MSHPGTSGIRKLGLTAHVVVSVGRLGAVAGFLALAIVGLSSWDAQRVRAAYLALEPLTWIVVVPFCLASLLTGIVQSLGTKWGLFRHYWVLLKLLVTVLATIVLLLHTQPRRLRGEHRGRGDLVPRRSRQAPAPARRRFRCGSPGSIGDDDPGCLQAAWHDGVWTA
jgi:hypothetical protein